jgi:glycosyltransferase involved in cell wall biosynthesis
VEVIVVDGGSTDRTVMTARELPLVNRVLQTTKGTTHERKFSLTLTLFHRTLLIPHSSLNVRFFIRIRLQLFVTGRSQQLNFGAANSTGNILLFLHSDTILPKGFDFIVRETLRFDRNFYKAFSKEPETQNDTCQNYSRDLQHPLHSQRIVGAFEFKLDCGGWQLNLIERVTNWRSRFLKVTQIKSK